MEDVYCHQWDALPIPICKKSVKAGHLFEYIKPVEAGRQTKMKLLAQTD
jgi:hypothetical protein